MENIESKEDSESHQVGTCADFKPGQKFATPSPGFGDRVFYETLLKQIPTSEMAQDWCLAYGTLEHDEATKLYEIVCKRKGKPIPTGKVQPSPLKKAPSSSNLKAATHKSIKAESVLISKSNPKASSSVSNKAISQKKARIIDDNQVETGFETSSSWEAVGSVGI